MNFEVVRRRRGRPRGQEGAFAAARAGEQSYVIGSVVKGDAGVELV